MALHFLSHAQQLAAHLRSEILQGKWSGSMPGILRLEGELGVNRNTIDAALQLLEQEGLLVSQGAGRRRKIVLPMGRVEARGIRVALLVFDSPARGVDYMIHLRHLLEEAGHVPYFPDKTLEDLGMDVRHVARFVKKTPADAWVVCASSREVLAWFAEQEAPAFALFGRHHSHPMAAVGPDKAPAYAAAARRLIELGHRRISHLSHRQQRLPQPSRAGQAFLDELGAAGIKTSDFNLPDWEPTSEGFTAQLDSMFRYTPPTALILDEPHLYSAALHFLAERGVRVPHDVSLICTDADRSFIWSEPSVAHIRWDYRPVIRRIVRWANNVSQDRHDIKQTATRAEFVPGGDDRPCSDRLN